MARAMPSLATTFRTKVDPTLAVARMTEILRNHPRVGHMVREELTLHRCCLIYELAYLRLFGLWEQLLEETIVRYLCGYTFKGHANKVIGGPLNSLTSARARLRQNRAYVLLHNPDAVIRHLNRLFARNRIRPTILSFSQSLQHFAHIRHRIAHDHADARHQFDSTSMYLTGRRYRGGRTGVLLREWTTFRGANVRWLQRIGEELKGIASQLAP